MGAIIFTDFLVLEKLSDLGLQMPTQLTFEDKKVPIILLPQLRLFNKFWGTDLTCGTQAFKGLHKAFIQKPYISSTESNSTLLIDVVKDKVYLLCHSKVVAQI